MQSMSQHSTVHTRAVAAEEENNNKKKNNKWFLLICWNINRFEGFERRDVVKYNDAHV